MLVRMLEIERRKLPRRNSIEGYIQGKLSNIHLRKDKNWSIKISYKEISMKRSILDHFREYIRTEIHKNNKNTKSYYNIQQNNIKRAHHLKKLYILEDRILNTESKEFFQIIQHVKKNSVKMNLLNSRQDLPKI
jgi:hypothetical protein